MKTSKHTALLVSLLLVSACRGKHNATAVKNEEPEAAPRIASTLKMSDRNASAQLLKGFYGVESGSWRWTAGHFSLLLRTPAGAALHGATLKLGFSIPDVMIQKLHDLTLTAALDGKTLKSETYSVPGSYSFSADVPPDQFTPEKAKETVTVDFALDKALPPGAADSRELGLVALSAGLESK